MSIGEVVKSCNINLNFESDLLHLDVTEHQCIVKEEKYDKKCDVKRCHLGNVMTD